MNKISKTYKLTNVKFTVYEILTLITLNFLASMGFAFWLRRSNWTGLIYSVYNTKAQFHNSLNRGSTYSYLFPILVLEKDEK